VFEISVLKAFDLKRQFLYITFVLKIVLKIGLTDFFGFASIVVPFLELSFGLIGSVREWAELETSLVLID
jgi:hypothetical protein